jgi:membrane associated rhomboid family serine protease
MLIPLRTDREPRRKPLITESLIMANGLVFLAGLVMHYADIIDIGRFTAIMAFDPQHFRAWQLLTSVFMHDPTGIWHLLFNMLFLWVFGGPVEDRLGRVGFLGFYLIAGIVASLAHTMVSPAPVIGASGAIAGVTGAFLALFPRSNIIVFWILTLSVMPISSLWLIGLYFTIDVLRQFGELMGSRAGRVAYMAHIAGYVYGFSFAFLLLAIRLVKREEYDVFFLFTQARRRAAFRAATKSQPAGMWDSAAADTSARLEKAKRAKPPTERELRLAEQRAEINRLAASQELPTAAARYAALLEESPTEVFAEPRQLELANQLYADGRHQHAATAYELLLQQYPRTDRAAEVRLILGVLYARHLARPELAQEHIRLAKPRLRSAGQTALADELLAELTQ